jgi:hypothetical protein
VPKTFDSGRTARGLITLASLLVLSACGKSSGTSLYAYTGPTPSTHRSFPILAGVHAVDCAGCHGTFASFKQFDCLGCHTQAPTAAVHTTTAGYAYDSVSCLACHADPTSHPFDHKGITTCASCHAAGAFYAALPVAGFTHADQAGQDCSACHAPATWRNATVPAGVVSDPMATVTVNALLARYSGTSIVQLTARAEPLPMGMNHATAEVDMAGLACSACHLDINAGSLYPGRLHSSLANLAQAAPATCVDCHSGSAPAGFVGPTATNPARSPASGEMKHDAVAWSAGVATVTRVVTADCGSCHVSPTAVLQATWATGTGGAPLARYHASLTAAGLPQPASCLDCHANSRPTGVVSRPATGPLVGLSFDHVGSGAMGDCAACHAASTAAWSGATYHRAGSANPTSCLPCHAGQRPTSNAGWTSTSYQASPFDYGTNAALITHGDGQDCAGCHTGPGTGGAWGGTQSFVGGRFTHGPGTVATGTCIACHMSQRPDLVMGAGTAAAALGGFDHSTLATGDCLGCHQATVATGSYVNYYGPGGVFPGGDWKGAGTYPGDQLVSAPNQFVTVTELTLVRPVAGGLVTGVTSISDTLYNAMLHTSAQIPAAVSPGPAATPDSTTCWHCHAHVAGSTALTSFLDGRFHSSLTNYAATPNGPVTGLPQPNGGCVDCHAQMRPPGIVERASSNLQAMDHAALFTANVTIGGKLVGGAAGLDCSTCHHATPGTAWSDGVFHASVSGAVPSSVSGAVPADCVACHYPLMADAPSANVTSGVAFAMSHASSQLTFQSCATCHSAALGGSAATPPRAAAWKPGAYHASVPTQPTGCIDCHAVSEPLPNASTQSTWTYLLAAGGTSSNAGQWMNHGAASVVSLDCAVCHAADARSTGSAWNRSALFHSVVAAPTACQGCHGLLNGGGSVPGTNNNLPAGLSSSTTLTTASANALTGVAVGTHDQITHADVNASSHDCNFCHTQVGRSTAAGVQGAEWAQARFHANITPSSTLVINGTTGRCSNCHMNVKPGPAYTAQDHSAFTSAPGTQDCSACHSWPGTGGMGAPDWKGGGNMPQYIAVGGFAIPNPPATVPTTQAGITNLPHPTPATGMACTACHAGGVGGKNAIGYDHASALANAACSACHEAGSNLVGTAWNGATTQASGAGDTRPTTITSLKATRGSGGGSCTLTNANAVAHFYPTQCGECHVVPKGTGPVTTGAAYASAWTFPHTSSKMTNPATCNLCHSGTGCSK